jgi:hypothetical protein
LGFGAQQCTLTSFCCAKCSTAATGSTLQNSTVSFAGHAAAAAAAAGVAIMLLLAHASASKCKGTQVGQINSGVSTLLLTQIMLLLLLLLLLQVWPQCAAGTCLCIQAIPAEVQVNTRRPGQLYHPRDVA